MTKRVLVVEATIFGYDGITSVVTNYYQSIDHEKVHMDVVTINSVDEKFEEIIHYYGGKNYVLQCRNRNPIKYVLSLKRILKSGDYHIIHIHGCSATMALELLAAKMAGIKVRIAHSHNTTCDHVIVDRILRPLFLRLYNVGFACGAEAGEWLFPNRKYFIMSNGIDMNKYCFNNDVREQYRKKYGLNENIVIGHIGRFNKSKNHRKLLEIFSAYSKNHNESKLVLIGDGELKEDIEKIVQKENLNVLFVGVTDDVGKWLQAMDIIVFPSLFEGNPLALIEAQAAGLPCVVSNTIAPDTKITDSLIFEDLDADPDKWCRDIDELLQQNDRNQQKKTVIDKMQEANFDIKKNGEKLTDKYLELLEGEELK